MAVANTKTVKDVAQLQTLFQGERAAVEAYRLAIEQVGASSRRNVLQVCLQSHQRSAAELAVRIEALGGEIDSRLCGVFTRAAERTAAVITAAVAAVESGEGPSLPDSEGDTTNQ